METTSLTPVGAIAYMRYYARDIINVELATDIVKAFGLELPEALVVNREVGASLETRETVHTAGPSIGVYQLASWIAGQHQGWEPEPSPYMGMGKTAEFHTMQACGFLTRTMEITEEETAIAYAQVINREMT